MSYAISVDMGSSYPLDNAKFRTTLRQDRLRTFRPILDPNSLVTQELNNLRATRIACFRSPHDHVQQIVIRQVQQTRQRASLSGRQIVKLRLGKPAQHQVKFKQATSAMPTKPIIFTTHVLAYTCPCLHHVLAYTMRLTSMSLILPMALVGLRPFGHTSTQFIIEWQRNKRYGSSRLSSRALLASSRLSARKRYA